MRVELGDILSLLPEKLGASLLTRLTFHLALGFEPWVVDYGLCNVYLITLSILSFIYAACHACIVESDLLNLSSIQVHSGKTFVGCHLSLC